MEKTISCPQCGSTEIFVRGCMCICGACMHRFEMPQEPASSEPPQEPASEKAAVPMRLFLSYGHPESEICQRIYAALKEHGYDPWFDQSNIRTGDNWRVSIQEGVRNSSAVVACLSPHSVRERGVCLDELAIAVGVKGGNVHSVLLAPEREVDPPATIGCEQWLDMSDWKKQKEAGDAAFEAWFRGRMQELFRVLDSKETREFNGQIQYIHEHLNVYYDTSRQNALLQKRFVGRTWLEERLEHWLDDPAGKRMCLLYGGPGVGKSAFAVHYTHYNSRVAACLFCRNDMEVYNAPRTVIQTLAYLLACRLPEYRQSLMMHLPENKAEMERLSEKELFAQLLEKPLSLSVDGGHQTMALVLDGLDECGSPEENALASTLAAYADSLPRWLRILIVARATPAVTAYAADAEKIEIEADAAANLADIRAYYEDRLQAQFADDPQWNSSLEALTARSQGTFLYAEMMCSLLQKRGTLSAAEEYPEGLDAMFAAWFRYFFPDLDDYRRNWRLPLSCLLSAKAPLPENALRRVMGWSAGQLRDFCQRINVLLRRGSNTFGDRTLSIDHAYIRQWLQRDQPYAAPAEDGIEAQAQAFYAHLEEDADSLSYYEAVQLPALLQQAGMKKQYKALVHSVMWCNRVLEAGDLCRDWGKLEEAEEIFTLALDLARQTDLENDPDAEVFKSCYQERLGLLQEVFGDLNEALRLYREALARREQLVRVRSTPMDKSNLAISYGRIAGIYDAQGHLDEALKLYQKYLTLREELVQERGMLDDTSELASGYNCIAGIHKAHGRLDEALALYQKSLTLLEQLAQERGTPGDKSKLAAICIGIAGIHEAKGRLDEALNWYQYTCNLFRQVAQERGTPDDKSSLAISCNCIAAIYDVQGHLDEALALYQKYVPLLEQVARERGTPGDKNNLAVSYNCLAAIYKAQGRLEEALNWVGKDRVLSEQVVQERGTPDDKSDLASSYGSIGEICQEQGHIAEALDQYQKSLALREQVVQERGTPEDKSSLAANYNGIAMIYKTQGLLDEALKWYQKDYELSEQVVRERGTPGDKSSLAASYSSVAVICETQDLLNEALSWYQEACALCEQVVQERGTPEDKSSLATSYGCIAGICETRGDLDRALRCAQEACALFSQVVQERSTPENKSNLATSYSCVAGVCNALGRPDEALEWYQKGRSLSEQVVRERNTPGDKRNLAASCFCIAEICAAQDRPDDALHWYQKACALFEQVAQERGAPGDLANLAAGYGCIGAIYESLDLLDEALEPYRKSLALQEQVVQGCGTPEDKNDLIASYDAAAELYEAWGRPVEADEFRQKANRLYLS